MEPRHRGQGRHRPHTGHLRFMALGTLLVVRCLPAVVPAQKDEPPRVEARVRTSEPASKTPLAPAAQKELVMSRLKRWAQEALLHSRRYLYPDALPGREAIKLLAADEHAAPSELAPLEQFFVYAVSSEATAKADPAAVARSYCVAMKSLYGRWWGAPGPPGTPAGRALLSLGQSAVPCLLELLGDETPLQELDGEENTMAKHYSWVIADRAAGFLSRILQQPFDDEAAPEERRAARKRLRAAAGAHSHGTEPSARPAK